jgi:Fe-S cluster assembly iron-binding protein IscA
MSMITLSPSDCTTIKSILSKKGLPCSIRIEIRSTGCCDASLGLAADTAEESDLVEEIEGLKIFMRPTLHGLVGEVSIRSVEDSGRNEFILVSEKPLNEWQGFAAGKLRT